MQVITDLQIHSKYSRAVSQQMVIPQIWQWAKRKGIDLIATGDWMHPLWMREIKANLEEMGNGLLKMKFNNETTKQWNNEIGPLFLLATEISSIYSQGGKGHRIHNLVWSPTIASADKINKELTNRGANLLSDGRPIVGLKSHEIAELVFTIDPLCLLIPAHVWTPWFSLYGSESGFDSITECFGEFAKNIYAIETGLSSDPSMNWRIKELDSRSILSFSDAHSGGKLGREATVFQLRNAKIKDQNAKTQIKNQRDINNQISYKDIAGAIKQDPSANWEIGYTIEFHPEEGKYHYTGHRNCGIKQDPGETKKKGVICPVCGRKLTIGVMHRVEQLAGRSEEELELSGFRYQVSEKTTIQMIRSKAFPNRPPYVKLVPLQEILAQVFGGMPTSKRVQDEYQKLTDVFGSEFKILLEKNTQELAKISGPKLAEAIDKVRAGDIFVDPGYDGVFGVVKIWSEKSKAEENKDKEKKEQMSLF